MKRNHYIAIFSLVLLSGFATGQTAGQSSTQTSADSDERSVGHYLLQETAEFGYRATSVSSQKLNPGDPTNFAMYDTLVNLHSGPRLLDETLSLRSPNHDGALFDDLFVSGFGFGGDPSSIARLQVSKYKWYDFNGLFRRDWNFFDYNLLANPLNPANSSPAIPVLSSPHQYNNVRRMTDLNLTVMPEARFSIRAGYSRNTFAGPSFSTIPEASDAELIETVLVQHNNVITDTYQVGFDIKVLPKTTLSYDQFISHTKYGTSWQDQSFAFVLPNGAPADLGIVWNTINGQPCAAPFNPAQPVADPTCSLYLAYLRTNPVSTNALTEQVSFRSAVIPKVDLNARATYTNVDMKSQFNDFFNGFLPDLGTRQFNMTGPSNGERISVNADFGATVHLTKRLRLIDRFRFYNFRIPTTWNSTTSTWVGGSALDPVGPVPDAVDNVLFIRFLGENRKWNEAGLEYDFTKQLGGRIGYKYRTTTYRHQDELNDVTSGDIETGEDIVDVHFHTAQAGIWFHPSNKFKANFDAELTTADNFLTRISPRRVLEYRFRTSYKPQRWITLAATANIYEARNGVQEIRYSAHTRNFGLNATVLRNQRFGVQLAYNYNNMASNGFICFQDTESVIPGNPGTCAADTDGGAPFELYETYGNRNHFGTATLLLKPLNRLTTNIGYSIVNSDGGATIINPLQPLGSLTSTYHRPLADLEFEIARGWSAIARWNYYEYKEDNPFFGPTSPRNFHANLTTISLRYAF